MSMLIFVAGATGATGRQLVAQLLEHGHHVVAVVRSINSLPEDMRNHEALSLIQASLLDLSDDDLAQHVRGCSAVVSCLGHNLTLKGIYGHPRRLVTDAVRRLCQAVEANQPQTPVRFVLMNTTSNTNWDLNERLSFKERLVLGLLHVMMPPQNDNEQAAEYLRTVIGQNNPLIEWAAVRPDSLLNEDQVTDYSVYPSPIRSSIFDPGTTSRINVGHFMMELITNDEVWLHWKGQMPVIYNEPSSH